MPLLNFKNLVPKLGSKVFIAPSAYVIGNVELADDCSVFFSAVLRGDIQTIKVGKGSNIQEHALLHSSHNRSECLIGEFVTIGHRAIVHGAKVGNNCIIGMGATILDDAVIEENCLIGAHALVTSKTIIPAGSLVMGSPAKVVRTLNEAEINSLKESAISYIACKNEYL
jgi:carbonic anhydrase/acetyltransferase-like protein (isoleucine patch superfamily)